MDGVGPCGCCCWYYHCGHLLSAALHRSWIHRHCYHHNDDHLAVTEAKPHAQFAALQPVVCQTQRKM
jgi:hypothetical protein